MFIFHKFYSANWLNLNINRNFSCDYQKWSHNFLENINDFEAMLKLCWVADEAWVNICAMNVACLHSSNVWSVPTEPTKREQSQHTKSSNTGCNRLWTWCALCWLVTTIFVKYVHFYCLLKCLCCCLFKPNCFWRSSFELVS